MSAAPTDTPLILRTAVTQTIGWGTLFIPFMLLVQPMEAELGWSRATLNGAFTLGLLLSGVLAIAVGRHLDRHGGRRPMVWGAALGIVGLLGWSQVNSVAAFYLAWTVIGVAHATALWGPAMAVVVAQARQPTRAITIITFITGFTGTVFVPGIALLEAAIGWRHTLIVLAGLEAVALVVAWGQFRGPAPPPRVVAPSAGLRAALRRPAFWGLALCLAAHGFIGTALGAHLVPLLREAGLPEASVLLLVALHGPAQVAARFAMFMAGTRASIRGVGLLATWLLPVGLLWLALAPPTFIALLPFVLAWAMADGLLTIIRAAAPAEFLGREGYGAVTGGLTLLAVLPRTAGPLCVALIWQGSGGYALVPWLLAGVGVVAAVGFWVAARRADQAVKRHRRQR